MDNLSNYLKELDSRDQKEDDREWAIKLLAIKSMQFNRPKPKNND